MPCDTLRINIQDASGDRVLAGELLTREDTNWDLWMKKRNFESHGEHEYQTLNHEAADRLSAQDEDAHVHHVLGEVRRNPRRKFSKGPRLRWGDNKDSCRIYGSLEGNKVQGDFHITARGHGYMELAPHLDHEGEMRCFFPLSRFCIDLILIILSLQFLPHDYRTVLRTTLSIPSKPS